jgi:hydrogenase maturation protein HypF
VSGVHRRPGSRYHIRIEGFVQGIGFRPFIYTLALDMNLKGWVNNDTEGVNVVIDCDAFRLQEFLQRVRSEKPALAEIKNLVVREIANAEPVFTAFEIHASEKTDSYVADVLPDLATCPECLRDVFDPLNRRFQYPFTNCTHCGPRFSIIQNLPYDRQNTTMAEFIQCEDCVREYRDPTNRRFHAQPNACPKCGPQVALCSPEGRELATGFKALEQSAAALRGGQVVALKGLGGYQLAVDARNAESVERLRVRKHRRRKPFAVMMRNLEEVQKYCHLNEIEIKHLQSPSAPIVLLRKKSGDLLLVDNVAPNNSYLGIFLPNTPLHHWLLHLFGGPIVLTSANLSDEPLVYTEEDAFGRLGELADQFLIHNRPIARPVDDSVVQVVEGQLFVLRSARGLAPLVLPGPSSDSCTLATGPHMKNTFCLGLKNKRILSQHLGDLESDRTQDLFRHEVDRYLKFYHQVPKTIVHDAHPGYFTTEWANGVAEKSNHAIRSVQHHRAHIYATLGERKVHGPFLGVAWDGTGYGDDGTIWGGEFFSADESHRNLKRVAHIRPFLLIGGEASVRAPWRVALSLLLDVDSNLARAWFQKVHSDKSIEVFNLLQGAWFKNFNSPVCTSMGRFLEGVSALLGIVQENEFEADAAIQLEALATQAALGEGGGGLIPSPNLWVSINGVYQWDWRVWVREAVIDFLNGGSPPSWSKDIHSLLVASIFELLPLVGQKQIVIGGGVFQNKLLLSKLMVEGEMNGIPVVAPSRVPLNDGGVALGQMVQYSME